jgi:hypothetical protein
VAVVPSVEVVAEVVSKVAVVVTDGAVVLGLVQEEEEGSLETPVLEQVGMVMPEVEEAVTQAVVLVLGADVLEATGVVVTVLPVVVTAVVLAVVVVVGRAGGAWMAASEGLEWGLELGVEL